ncbi:MAG: beta-ketoacyl synthase chain length factor [Bacteroidales bacterium]|nr:beta-ketoacyl synthase chain length factor [Bacteroidales bacterium]
MSIYIQSASQISFQQPLCEKWLDEPILPIQSFNQPMEPDYKQFIAPAESRRMGKLLKRAVATALDTLAKGGCEMPDAIISGTGLGCVENTEKFLNAVIDNEEECLPPTPFMQSTHNTISSQISLKLQCHGYNSTYSHRGTSFDSALLDAVMQLQLGRVNTALVGGYDEMTPAYFKMLGKLGYWRDGDVSIDELKKDGIPGAISGGASVSALLGNKNTQNALCQLVDTEIFSCNSVEKLQNKLHSFLNRCQSETAEIDAVMCGLSGDKANDDVYRDLLCKEFPTIPTLWYKHLFGESFCASGYGIYCASHLLNAGKVPDLLIYNGKFEKFVVNNILIINHFQNNDFSLTLLTKCHN